ncbi:hypothetical protein [Pengzhenrongella phosphoraccumulans]|uniref:hypothetical protein n=1 Tax=Pengzhenrongella phosphoraccumulans TaxID=3114394 RepID=UPI00388F5018
MTTEPAAPGTLIVGASQAGVQVAGQGRHIPAGPAADSHVPLTALVVDGPVPAGATP